MNGLDISGFPSLRIWVEYNNGVKLEDPETIDGFGSPPKKVVTPGNATRYIWDFNLREIIYSILSAFKAKDVIISKSTHRRQDDGTPNDPVLFKREKTTKQKT
jgi:hypothetical protein